MERQIGVSFPLLLREMWYFHLVRDSRLCHLSTASIEIIIEISRRLSTECHETADSIII